MLQMLKLVPFGPGPFLYLIDWEIRLAAKDFNLCLANLLLKMQC
jgi:hypothetical protein